jgi:glucose-1-phosphate cytidylyltransferase
MKVIILAGGFGTQLGEYTDLTPKPMIMIGGKPILWHIMKSFSSFGYKEFILALGYKADVIKQYFLSYRDLCSDFTVDLGTGQLEALEADGIDWNVTLVDTGRDSMTGGRVKRLERYVRNEPFF